MNLLEVKKSLNILAASPLAPCVRQVLQVRSPAPSSGSSPEKLFLITVPSQEQGQASREGVGQVV